MSNIYELPDRKTIEEEAWEWLIKLDSDQAPSENELEQLREWLARSSLHREELNKANSFWGVNVLTELVVPLDRCEQKPVLTDWLFRFRYALTTVLVVFLGATLLFIGVVGGDNISQSNGLYLTAVGRQETTSLVDGSTVQLNTNSQIKVEYDEGYRNIWLIQGEAHFEVSKDPTRPFRVYAGSGRVEAVGTAFTVRLKEDNVNVLVTEGKVVIASLVAQEGLGSSRNSSDPNTGSTSHIVAPYVNSKSTPLGTLTAGQRINLRPSAQFQVTQDEPVKGAESVSEEELNRRQSWRDGFLDFEGEPLGQVVEEISRFTTMSIEIVDPEVKSIQIGGRFKVGNIAEMLDALEHNFDLSVNRVSYNHVKISVAKRSCDKSNTDCI